jgi:hypothetical protein
MSLATDDDERAWIQLLDDRRRMNRMLRRKHPLFALRCAMAGRFTVDDFWLPIAASLGQCMGYGAGALGATTRTRTRPLTRPRINR